MPPPRAMLNELAGGEQMTVEELIEMLQQRDPAAKVLIPRHGRFVEPGTTYTTIAYGMEQDYRTEYHISGPWKPEYLDTIRAVIIE